MVMDLVSAVACETAKSASRIERLARTFIWVIPFMGRMFCDDGLNDEARSGNRGPVQSGDRLSNPRYSVAVDFSTRNSFVNWYYMQHRIESTSRSSALL